MRLRLLLTCLLATPLSAATYTVITPANAGPGSLREAILNANATPGPDHIVGSYRLISRPTSALPTITDSVIMEEIYVDGAAAGAANGLVFESGENDLHEIGITNFSGDGLVFRGKGHNFLTTFAIGVTLDGVAGPNGGNGLVFENSSDNRVGGLRVINNGNYITEGYVGNNGGYGVLITGSASARIELSLIWIGIVRYQPHPNRRGGIRVVDATEIGIGGSDIHHENFIAANEGNGIELVNVTKSRVRANFIGEHSNRSITVANRGTGIVIEGGSENLIDSNQVIGNGGDGMVVTRSHRNTIVGQHIQDSAGDGIRLVESTGNTIGDDDEWHEANVVAGSAGNGLVLAAGSNGNLINTNTFTGNARAGILISNSANNMIGSEEDSPSRELIIGPNQIGVEIAGSASTGNVIRDAVIGHDDDSWIEPVGNSRAGVLIHDGASGNAIGVFGLENLFIHNRGPAISIASGLRNRIDANRFVENTGLPIDLGGDGATPNDAGDADSGPNALQNFPVLHQAYDGQHLVVEGTLRARPNTIYTLHVYGMYALENRLWQATTATTTTDANGESAFRLSLPGVIFENYRVALTATDPQGNTSELSAPVRIKDAGHILLESQTLRVHETAGYVDVVVIRSGPPDWPASVDYRTVAAQATAGSDFTATTGRLEFLPGESHKSIRVPIARDAVSDPNETFVVELSSIPTGELYFILDQNRATVTIVESPPAITIADPVIDESTGAVTFTITMDAAFERAIAIDYRTIAGSARDGEDFAGTSGRVEIPAGQTTATVNVRVTDDIAAENDEYFRLVLQGADGATLADPEAMATIRNDDGMPVIAADDVEVMEGQAVFVRFRLTGLNHRESKIKVRTVPGSASMDDFSFEAKTLTFLPGRETWDFYFFTQGDRVAESTETMYVELYDAENAILPRERITITVRDDPQDTLIAAEVENIRIAEGDNGIAEGTFVVRLSRASDTPLTITYRTVDNGNGNATAGIDYESAQGSLVFAPGETEKRVTLRALGDAIAERTENVGLSFEGAPEGQESAHAYIVNDDGPAVRIADATSFETHFGSVDHAVEVTLDEPVTEAVRLQYFIEEGHTAGEVFIVDEDDIREFVSFPAGSTRAVIEFATRNFEEERGPNELFTIRLRDPNFARIADGEALITVVDDVILPAVPSVSIRDAAAEETSTLKFVVELSHTHEGWVGVDLETTPGTAGGADFTTAATRVTFAPGETKKIVEIAVTQDGIDEEPEWLFAVLRNASKSTTIVRGVAAGTIYDPGERPQRRRSARH